MSFLENRRIVVKWNNTFSSEKKMNAGGPQGSTTGILEFLSISNDNSNCIPEEQRFSYIDDLSCLELVNLLIIGLQTQNLKQHVPSNLPVHNQTIQAENLKTQHWVNEIKSWTDKNLMKLNPKKCKNIIFNFSRNNQFATSIKIDDQEIETVDEAKLLGTYVTSDLKWDKNTEEIIKDCNKRLRLLHAASKLTRKLSHLKHIYNTFVRSRLESSSSVWHSMLTQNHHDSLERIQKSAFRVILKEHYKDYEHALKMLNMQTLFDRRERKCLTLAKKCLRDAKLCKMFPLKNDESIMNRRKSEKYKVIKAKTCRLMNSPIIYMQKLLNQDYEKSLNEKLSILSKNVYTVPTTHACAVVENINSLN